MMKSKIGVLVFPAGEINSIELHDALATCVNIDLYGASSVDRHGEYVYKNYISGLPRINEPTFIEELNQLIEEKNIRIIFPTHDDVALFLAREKEKIRAQVLTSDYATALVCRDKKKTYELFCGEDFCPQLFEEFSQVPVFIKPRVGQGGVGTKLIQKNADIPWDIQLKNYVVCEYLPGNEMTVDCFTDINGELQAVLPRSRQRVFNGVAVHAKEEKLTHEIKYIAENINKKLHFIGLWYFQIKQDSAGKYKLMEISTRCAGTMCMARAYGVNLPLLSVYAGLGIQTDVFSNQYELEVDRTLISRYKTNICYESVYIDLDDTILINGKVHLPAMWFLYQCINEQKRIILLTRHQVDHRDTVKEVLKQHCISYELFCEVIELSFEESKVSVINPDNAIFIDNAYAERKEVHEKLHIPVFDVDGIEVLMDWRN